MICKNCGKDIDNTWFHSKGNNVQCLPCYMYEYNKSKSDRSMIDRYIIIWIYFVFICLVGVVIYNSCQ